MNEKENESKNLSGTIFDFPRSEQQQIATIGDEWENVGPLVGWCVSLSVCVCESVCAFCVCAFVRVCICACVWIHAFTEKERDVK